MDDEKHFPPGSDAEQAAAQEAAAQAEVDAKAAADKAAADAADHAKADEQSKADEEAKAKAEADAKAAADEAAKQQITKKPRSIYDDLKEERRGRKEAQVTAQTAEERAVAAEAKAAELQALLDA